MNHANHAPAFQPLSGIRILSLALNLPGPAALLRCRDMGAHCTKLEPLAPAGTHSADPMHLYSPEGYADLHAGVHTLQANLKTPEGQELLQRTLRDTDVLITSFRPSALQKLGLDWATLSAQHPRLCMVRIFGDTRPEEADHAGHDLTYQAQAGLTDAGHLPPTLFADMGGALMASEAVLQTLLLRSHNQQGHCLDVGLFQAAQWLALPRHWRMTTPQGDVGGAHAGYRMYACLDGFVALAALEPHFAQRLCQVAGLIPPGAPTPDMHSQTTAHQITQFLAAKTCAEIAAMAAQSDIPLHLISSQHK